MQDRGTQAIEAVSKVIDIAVIICLILLGAFVPVLFLWVACVEGSTWLNTGTWAGLSIGRFMEPINTEMVGVRRIAEWIYGLSLLIPLALLSLVMWVITLSIGEGYFGRRG